MNLPIEAEHFIIEQPAAPVLCHPTDPCRHGITGPCSRCQTAAPTPVREYTWDGYALPMMPAAPGPNADTPSEGNSDLSAALARVEFEAERAESAESQLAAALKRESEARDIIDRVMSQECEEDNCGGMLDLAEELDGVLWARDTPAPSPGDGGTT